MAVETLTFPLRIDRTGKLARGDRIDAVVALCSTMLATYSTQWPHAPWFGLAEQAEQLNQGLSEQGGLRDSFNTALDQLGIDWARVLTVTSQAGPVGSGTLQLGLSLSVDGGDVVFRPLVG